MNALGGLIIFWMLEGCDASCHDTVIPALSVHLLLMDFYVVQSTLVLHSGTSSTIIPLFNSHCSAQDLSLLIGVVAG